MRLTATVTATLAALGLSAATAAAAPINTYTASIAFNGHGAGTRAKPVPYGYTENLKIAGTGGNRPGVQLVIKTHIDGLQEDGKDFPTCTVDQINAARTDTGCPRDAEVATGNITATIGSAGNFAAAGAPCDPLLDVWNGGQGKLAFFFVETPTHQCLGGQVTTGSVQAYPATYREQGGALVLTVPVPDSVNYPLGVAGGLVGSLESEHLTYFKRTRTVHGHTVAVTSSVGCQAHQRPYQAIFDATLPTATPPKQMTTLRRSAGC